MRSIASWVSSTAETFFAVNAADSSTALLKLHSDLATACSCSYCRRMMRSLAQCRNGCLIAMDMPVVETREAKQLAVIARLDRAISTPRPLDSTTTVSGILDAPLSRGMTVSDVTKSVAALQLSQQRIAAGDFDLAGHRLEVQLLDHAVLDQHRVALGADAEAVAGGVELHADRLGEVGIAVGEEYGFVALVGVALPGVHDEGVVDGDDGDGVHALVLDGIGVEEDARQVHLVA